MEPTECESFQAPIGTDQDQVDPPVQEPPPENGSLQRHHRGRNSKSHAQRRPSWSRRLYSRKLRLQGVQGPLRSHWSRLWPIQLNHRFKFEIARVEGLHLLLGCSTKWKVRFIFSAALFSSHLLSEDSYLYANSWCCDIIHIKNLLPFILNQSQKCK